MTDIYIRRPKNCFMIWSNEHRPIIRKQCPKISNSEISVILGKIWYNLSEKEKNLYKEKSIELTKEHKIMFPDYKYRPIPKKEKKENIQKVQKIQKKENIQKIQKIQKVQKVQKVQKIKKIKKNVLIASRIDNYIHDEYVETVLHQDSILNNFEPDYFIELESFYRGMSFEN